MKLVHLSEKQAEKEGTDTPYSVVKEQFKAIENENVKHIICVTQNSDDTVTIRYSASENTRIIGLLDCGKYLVIEDMYD